MLLFAVIFFSTAIGVALAIKQVSKRCQLLVYVLLFLVTGLLHARTYFGDDPGTWGFTYISGLIYSGLGYLIISVIPALIAFWVKRACLKRRVNK